MNDKKDIFSYEPNLSISSISVNELPIISAESNIKTPIVHIDRKAKSSLIKGIFSCIFFILFPIAVSAIADGIGALRSPNRKRQAEAGIVLGIFSLALFIALVILIIIFYDKIVESNYFKSVIDLIGKLWIFQQ